MSDDTHDKVRQLLDENYESYVLITCSKSKCDGKLGVKMDYSGDPVLAAYLLQGAQVYLEDQQEETIGLIEESIY